MRLFRTETVRGGNFPGWQFSHALIDDGPGLLFVPGKPQANSGHILAGQTQVNPGQSKFPEMLMKEYNVGTKLKKLRLAKNLTVQSVASDIGFSPSLISQLEHSN